MNVKPVDVFDVELVQSQIEKAVVYLHLLVDIYSDLETFTRFSKMDGEELSTRLIIGADLVETALAQTRAIVSTAFM